jgi:sugar/nucleoside kinase (ribokinase family)
MQVRELLALRAKHDAQQRIHIIWEPQVKHCVTDLLEEHLKTAALVHVFSPNHVELESLFSNTPPVHFDQARIEGRARHFLDYGIDVDGRGVIVVRAAEHGCLVMTRRMKPLWLPAVHQSDSNKVVDATGAGNAFLGGFAMGMLEMMDDVAEAAVYGQVAASFAIEQVGVPTVTGDGEAELWNDESVHDRLETYRETVRDLILECYGITAARSNIPKDHCSDENWAKRSASISKRKRHASGTQESRKAVHRSRHSGSQ